MTQGIFPERPAECKAKMCPHQEFLGKERIRPLLFAFPHPSAPALPGEAALRLCLSLLPEILLQEPSSTSSLAGNQLPAGFF